MGPKFFCSSKMAVTRRRKHLNQQFLAGSPQLDVSYLSSLSKRDLKHSGTFFSKICMRPWIRSLWNIWPKRPLRDDFLALIIWLYMIFEAFYMIIYDFWRFLYDYIRFVKAFWRKIVITRRCKQLRSSYFACKGLWTCWIRFWYSQSLKLTKMVCFCWFSFLTFCISFICSFFGEGYFWWLMTNGT